MALSFSILKILGILSLTGFSLFHLFPQSTLGLRSWVDRGLLSLFAGMAFFTLFFLWAQGILGLPIRGLSLIGVFCLVLISGLIPGMLRRKRRQTTPSPQPPGSSPAGEIWVALGLLLIFSLALWVRLQNGMEFPDKLLDSDPYRHHIRTVGVLASGHLSPFEPYQIGQVPIFELQGCYIFAAILGIAGGIKAWDIWMWGGQIFGALSVLGAYLLAKWGLQEVLQRDLGQSSVDGIPITKKTTLSSERAGSYLGLITALLLAASPVHILRTNGGFSEAFAIALMGPTLLYYLRALQKLRWSDFVWFGVYYTALALINPVPAVFLVPFLAIHSLYILVRYRSGRSLAGIAVAALIFASSFMIWNVKFLAVPLGAGAQATSLAGTQGMQKGIGRGKNFSEQFQLGLQTFRREITRNVGLIHLQRPMQRGFFRIFGLVKSKTKLFLDWTWVLLTWVGAILLLRDPKTKRWRFGLNESFFFFSLSVFYLVLFLIPFGFISFTSKYYRYILPLSFSASLLLAYGAWRLVIAWGKKARQWRMGLALCILLALALSFEARTWGHWELDCSPEEYAAAHWINSHTDPDAILIANWYTGDFLRSLTKRRVLISDYPRIEVREALKRHPLALPILPRSPTKVWEYVAEHPGDYYVVSAKWGPFGDYANHPNFTLLQSFGSDPKTRSQIFRVERNP